jgi:hypothetical protein
MIYRSHMTRMEAVIAVPADQSVLSRAHDQWHGILLAGSIDAKSLFGSVYPAEYQ